MNLNYHYYTIKTLAVYAGFPETQAQCIAHFSQYVDDFVLSNPILVDKKPPQFFLEHGLAEEVKSGTWSFLPCTTGIAIINSIVKSNQLHTLVPFHFMPSRRISEIKADKKSNRKAYRCVEAGQELNLLINQLMGKFLRKLKKSRETKDLMELGMMLHTYADTYAHCNFSGFNDWENDNRIKRVYNKHEKKEEVCDIEKTAFDVLPSIGHSNVGTTPDCCYYKITYALRDSKEGVRNVIYERDNTDFFGKCSRNILNYLCTITGKKTLSEEEWNSLQKNIAKAQSVTKEKTEYLNKSWSAVFPNIKYHYQKNEYFDIQLNCKKTGNSILDKIECSMNELSDIYSSNGNQARDNCIVTAKNVNQAFFDYNELAFNRVFEVTGEYCSAKYLGKMIEQNVLMKTNSGERQSKNGKVTLADISLAEFTMDDFPLLKEMKNQLLTSPTYICTERAKYITEYMKSQKEDAMEKEPLLYRAKAVRNYLNNKKAIFPDKGLLAGTTGSRFKTAPVYPEYIGLTIWSELETISGRKENPLSLTKKDAELLNYEIYPYWIDMDVLSATKNKYGNTKAIRMLEKLIFFVSGKAGCISHTVPEFRKVLEIGIDGVRKEVKEKERTCKEDQKEFYQAVAIALEGITEYATHLSKEAKCLAEKESDIQKKKHYLDLAAVCAKVPKKPAETLREAVNCIWILLIAIHAENINMAISPGRLDQILYPYYKRDREKGNLTLKEAMELIGCLWIKMGDNVDLVPQVSQELFGGAGTAPAVTFGGVDEKGEDAVNDMTYIMLRMTELLRMREPNTNVRYHYEKNPTEFRNRVSQVIANTKAVPAFHNDVENIKTLQNQGVSLEDARDYSIIGCVELAVSGKSYDASSSIILNLAAPLEMTLYNGKRFSTGDEVFGPQTGDPANFKTFLEFMRAFQKQTKWLAMEAIDLNEKMATIHQKMLPTPLLSALFDGPLESGKDLIFGGADYNSSGVTHVGFADVVDSLNAVKYAVYDEKYCTMKELIKAVKTNFKDKEDLRLYLVNKAPKYGMKTEVDLGISKNIIQFLYGIYQNKTNYRGGKYRPAYWTMTNHAGQGKITYALPNGRKAYQPFASGITPVSEAAKNLTECLNSVASLGSTYIPGGEALNIKFTSIRSEQEIIKLGHFVETYFKNGGQQVQFNIMSHEMLKDAKLHPEKYKDLLVRVSGYSAYFNDLNDTMKNELITRTEYDIKNGKSVI